MDFEVLTETDLKQIESELAEASQKAQLSLAEIEATVHKDFCTLEITATQLNDQYLASSGNANDRRIRYLVRLFAVSQEDDDRHVAWGRIEYSVARAASSFFPVPDEYGDNVTLQLGWEFDRDTLEPGTAELRDCNRLHYISVLPNDQFVAFIRCCSEVAERWLGEK